MSNVVKFPGQEEPVPDNVVNFPDAAQREAVKPVRRGKRNPRNRLTLGQWCMVSISVLFMVVRYAAAISLQLALTIPLAVVGGFRWLICFFSMMALIVTWFVSTTMNGKLSPSEIHNVNTVYLDV